MRDDITTAGQHDVERVAAIMGQGFSDDPVMTWVLSDTDDDGRVVALTSMFAFIAREVVIDFGATHLLGDGCAMWTPPDPPEWPPDRGERFLAEMGAVASDEALARLGHVEGTMEQHRPPEPHWYLGAVACTPASRGQGIGGALLDHGLLAIDEAGMPAYLESSNPRNRSLYERKGFEVTGVADLPGGPSLTMMWRRAR